MLVFFPGFGGPDRSFWPDVRRDVRPKTSSLGCSPRASVKCRFGPSSAGFDLFVLPRLGCLSAGFGVLTAGFAVFSAGFPRTEETK